MAKAGKKSDDYIVSGRVIYSESGQPAIGVRVTVMDADLLFDDKLGEAVTDDDGRFSIRYGIEKFRDLFERPPDIYLLIHDREGEPLTSTRDSVIRNAGKKQEIHVQLPETPAPSSRTIYVGGLQVDRQAFEKLSPEDVLIVARSVFAEKLDDKAVELLKGLHPQLADDLVRPKLCLSPITRVLKDIVSIKNYDREILLKLEELFTGYPRFGGFVTHSCGYFNINYQTTGSTAVNTTTSDTDIIIPGTTTVVGNTSGASNSLPNYIQRLCFWLNRAYGIYTNPPFGLKAPGGGGIITVDVTSASYGSAHDSHININCALSDDMLAWIAVHELMHCIQEEYEASGTAGGWNPGMVEGGAVFGEDVVLDPINRYAAEADCWAGEGSLRHPEYSLMNLSYKLSLLLKYISEQQSSRVNPSDEPLIGVETYRELLETFDAHGYDTAAFEQAVRKLPWYQSFYKFGYLGAMDETSSETLLGNFWLACYLKDFGTNTPDRRFDFMEDEQTSLADDIFPAAVSIPGVTIDTLRSVVLQADVTLNSGVPVTLSSGAGGTVNAFAARFYKVKVSPFAAINTLRVSFSAGAGFNQPLVQIVLVERGNTVRDILRSDRTTWNRTIANDRSGTTLDHLLIVVAGTDTGGTFTLSVQDVPAAPDVMVTRWHHLPGTHYEIDSFGWQWTWVSPDIWVDTNMDGIADDVIYFNKNNKLFIRLRNQGNRAAFGIYVKFWYQDTSGGLSDSAWLPVQNTSGVIQVLSGLTLSPQSSGQWSVDWAPAPSGSSNHFCVRAIVTVPNDPNINNKRCLSNFGNVIMDSFTDLALVRRAYLDRYEDVKVLVIPRTHGRFVVSKLDLDRINKTPVKVGSEVTDLLRVRRMDILERVERVPGQSHLERLPDSRGHYPTDPRCLPPGMEKADLITIAHVVDGRPIGGFTWAIHSKRKE